MDRDFFVWGGDIRYGKERYKFEAEFLSRRNYFDNQVLNAGSVQGAYSIPLNNTKIFKDITPALRWDVMGHAHNNNLLDVSRLTAGLSFGFDTKPFSSLLRIDINACIREGSLNSERALSALVLISPIFSSSRISISFPASDFAQASTL